MTVFRRLLNLACGRAAAAVLLAAGAAGSVALAVLGADRSLALMKTVPALCGLGTAALALVLACVLSRRPCVWLLHLGLAFVFGGWIADVAAHRSGAVPADRTLWLAEPMEGVARDAIHPEGVLRQLADWEAEETARDKKWRMSYGAFTNFLAAAAAVRGQDGRLDESCSLSITNFSIETWPGLHTVKSYASDVVFSDGTPPARVLVNHPLRHRGWWLYQNSWERAIDSDYIWQLLARAHREPRPGELPPEYAVPMYHFMMRAKPSEESPMAYWTGLEEHYAELAGMCRERYGKPPPKMRPWCFTGILCVKDVGLPYVFAGALMLIAGALIYLVGFFRRATAVFDDRERAASELTLAIFGGVCTRYELRPFRWSKPVRTAYALLFAGVLAMLVHRTLATGHPPMQNLYEFLMCAAAFMPVLTFVSWKVDRQDTLLTDAFIMFLVLVPVCFAMDGEVKKLMPALQSPFFVPHVGSYIIGYVLLMRAALGAGRRLVGAGFFLLTLGLALGAIWGKVCWGHWWQFDPKEMWSLATWFVYAAYFHLRPRLSPRVQNALLAVGALAIVLTLTWINLSRVFKGVHSYA